MFPEWGAKARVLRESLQSVAVFFIYMPAGRGSERAELVIFIAFLPFEILETAGGGWIFRWISSVGGGASGMHAIGSGEPACCFYQFNW